MVIQRKPKNPGRKLPAPLETLQGPLELTEKVISAETRRQK